MRQSPAVILAASLLVPALASAQTPAPPAVPSSDAAAVQRAAQEAAEDLVLKRVIAGLQLTDRQMRALLPTLQDDQTRLQALERENADAVARHKPALEEARNQLLAGKAVTPRAETQYSEALKLAQTRRTQLRADLVGSLKRLLAQELGPQQEALILQTARSVISQERIAAYRAEAMTGSQGGGPINGLGRMLDRIRNMSPEEWQNQQTRMSQFTNGGGGGRGGRGARGGAGGGGGNPQQMAQAQQQQAQAQQRMAMMSQLRSMSPEQYQLQRENLALQMLGQVAGRFGDPASADPQAQVDAFIDRYFLSPRIVPVFQQRLGGTASHAAGSGQ